MKNWGGEKRPGYGGKGGEERCCNMMERRLREGNSYSYLEFAPKLSNSIYNCSCANISQRSISM